MILHALTDYYERLAESPGADIAEFGFSRQKISFAVVIAPDGKGFDVQPVGLERKGKRIAESMIVIGNAKPPGQGISPCFLWDNMAYMLGLKADDEKPERTQASFEAFREKHLELAETIADEHYSLVCEFLRQWNPFDADLALTEIGTGFGVFRIRGIEQYVHQRDAIQGWWRTQVSTSTSEKLETAQCLVSGTVGPIARLHEPKIKGVVGAQSSGAAIVSFNLDAFESYGKTQSYNAPVSKQAAFQYTTALNRLLASKQRFQIGDSTTVFWTAKPSPIEDFFGNLISDRVEDESLKSQLHEILKDIAKGQCPSELGDPATEFYVLGLSPNASRLSVRFWHVSTIGTFVESIRTHFSDLSIVAASWEPQFPGLWQILRETSRETKDVAPLLVGGLMRALLNPSINYPAALYNAILRRIATDRRLTSTRCGLLKAYLTRTQTLQRSITVGLDTERTEVAYHLGRLFSALERAQEVAHTVDKKVTINDTIKDKFFGAASASPSSVFPRLIRLSQHHLHKIERPRTRVFFERKIGEIFSLFDVFPNHLGLRDQGLFAIGYYHQRQDFFQNRTDSSDSEETEIRNPSQSQPSGEDQ
ncbi:MAG: type I-C CRISPR-associated protein Cas8c/Csd1 [Planctomycetota bacterium]